MAYVEKKKNGTYLITVSQGYDVRGKQVRQTKIFVPLDGMSAKAIEKELQRQSVLFEEECKGGYLKTSVKFEDFAEQWFNECGKLKLKKNTYNNYLRLSDRTYSFLGHIRLDKLTQRDIQKFILHLVSAERKDGRKGKLSPKTVKLHLSFVSTVCDYALKLGLIQNNPCKNVVLPKPETKEKEIYTVEEAREIVNCLYADLKADIACFPYVMFYILATVTGFRRGEIMGLEYRDLDFNDCTISLNRASYYNSKDGIFTDTLKTATSKRTLKLSDSVFELLSQYRDYQHGIYGNDIQRLFVAQNGSPMNPSNPHTYFRSFCYRYKFKCLGDHSFRHFAATVQISSGVDVKTVQSVLGHSTPITTLNIYSHVFKSAQTQALETVSMAVGL